ncbi:GNAT family N-acetyltransferase [Anaerosporobacter faecicola]|uniref:GNAT family N-acetyltransferase n=1 Tax=Anaerosporobacter faecicola TaxID=2718714 RepID=UPI0014390323|nr:GNAT family N-acetyltransferase [Anaerosporobacter faecicola]
MEFKLKTERLIIQPFDYEYLEQYYREFTDEITKYQYPDRFNNIEEAKNLVSEFVEEMKQGNMLELVILTSDGEFLGSMEAFGIREETPEVGLWLKQSIHKLGYGYEALKALIDDLSARETYRYFTYEADVRNEQSIHLVEKFAHEKLGCEEIVTESGKKLKLQTYHILPSAIK